MIKKKYIKVNQGPHSFYMINLNFLELDSFVSILTYKDDKEYGYQRTPNPKHYKKIQESFMKQDFPIYPTSILLGVDSNAFSSYIDESYISIDENVKKMYRVIDGQHRYLGLKSAIDAENDSDKKLLLETMEFPVVIIPIEQEKRSMEVEIFCDVNFSGKPLKSDLAFLARYRYELLEYKYTKKLRNPLYVHLGVSIINYLLNNQNIWKDAFIFDSVKVNNAGIISYLAFNQSLYGITTIITKNMSEEEYIDNCSKITADVCENLIIKAWNIIVELWPESFNANIPVINEEGVKLYYDKGSVIQKNLGVKVLNGVLGNLYKENLNYEVTLNSFRELLLQSGIEKGDWKSGSLFSGYSSESAFGIFRDKIQDGSIRLFAKQYHDSLND